MVEPLLYAALGFLTASLVALFMGRALWKRAVRLTTHRIMRRLPLSRDEIVASRDLLRAQVAIEHRRLERQTNLMRQRMTESMADVGRRDATILSLRTATEEANARTAAAETRETGARKAAEQARAETAAMKAKLDQAERTIGDYQLDQKRHEKEHVELVHLADNRRLESATAATEAGQLRLIVGSLERQLEAAQKELTETRARLDQANEAFRAETDRAEAAHAKLIATESQLAQALTSSETEGRDSQSVIETLRAEKAALEGELSLARVEKDGAERQVNSGSEEIALLRQQIERLAADIARVASAPNGRGQTSLKTTQDAGTVGA